MKQILRGAGAVALGLVLVACGAAPTTPGAGTTGTSGAGTSATSEAGTTGTTAAGTTGTTAAGTTGTTAAGTTGTTAAGTTGTTAAGTTGTTAAGTTGTTAAGTTGTTTAGTTGTTTAGTTGTTAAGTTGTTTAGTTGLGSLTTDPRFSTLSGLLVTTGLDRQLEALGPFTLFAPTNDAFAALPAGTLNQLAANPTLLQQILLYHVTRGDIRSSDITASTTPTTATTVEGQDVTIAASNGTVTINGTARVVAPDITAGQGVIHAIDQVLLPPGVALGS